MDINNIIEELKHLGDSRIIQWVIFSICLLIYVINWIIIESKHKENEDKSSMSMLNNFILIFVIFYLYFLNCIKIKAACGLHTNFIETLKFWNLFKNPNDIKCFTYKNGFTNKNGLNWNINNTINIDNLNTDNILISKKKILKRNRKFDYTNKYQSNSKYLFVTVYGIILIFMLFNLMVYVYKGGEEENITSMLQVMITLCCFMIFFIWTCVVNLPLWIIFLIIFLCIIIYLFVSIITLFTKYKNSPESTQHELCKPYIIPFVNESWTGVDFSTNLNRCMTESYDNLFAKSIEPLIKTFGTINNIILGQGDMISQLTSSVSFFKEQIKTMAEDIYNKIESIFNTIWDLINKIYEIFKKLFTALGESLGLGANLSFAFATIMNVLSPVLKLFGWFCFDPDTLLDTDKGKVKIKNIKIGDILSDNSKVIGILKFKYNKCQMYDYQGIIVSDSHLVYEYNKWIQVKNSKIAKKVDYNKKELYCLITDTHKININKIIFSDYFDYNLDPNDIQDKVLSILNGYSIKNINKKYPLWAFYKNTMIDTASGRKKISEFNIDDDTLYGKVNGIIKVKIEEAYVYNNIITSGDQIVLYDNIYLPIKKLPEAKKIDVDDNIFYHLADSSYKLSINKMLFTDFLQCNDSLI